MKKVLLFLLTAILLLTACGCTQIQGGDSASTPPSVQESPSAGESPDIVESPSVGESQAPPGTVQAVMDYYPILKNVHYFYNGEGNEYAEYDVYIDYSSNTAIQERVSNAGTVTAKVINFVGGKVIQSFTREETYFRENFLKMSGDNSQVLLMEPIEAGMSWTQPDGSISTITDTAAKVETPSGSYVAVCVETQGDDYKTFRYYAKGVGLVKTVFKNGDSEVSSTLAKIQNDVPLTQTVRFYYPNAEDGKLYYRDIELSFNTNDVTAQALEAAYKADFEGKPGTVLTDNTVINLLQLDPLSGMLHIDLNKAFITEMGGGSSYETRVLQSLVNTFGAYYGVSKVIPTIDGALYESAYMVFEQGAYLTVNTEDALALEQIEKDSAEDILPLE